MTDTLASLKKTRARLTAKAKANPGYAQACRRLDAAIGDHKTLDGLVARGNTTYHPPRRVNGQLVPSRFEARA